MLSTTRLREIKKSLDPFITFQYIFSYAYLTLFLLLPIATIIEQAFLHDGSFSLHWFEKVLSDPDFFSLKARGGMMFEVHGDTIYIWGIDHGYIMNSLIVAATVTISTSLIGVLTALIIARYDFPGKNIFRVMVLIPMLATPFVNAYVIGKFFQPRGGLLNFLFYDVLHILPWRIDVNGLVGIAVAQTLAFYPIVYLNVFASLMTMDPTMEEQAESLGAGGFKLFRTITLPLSMPGLAAGATIVFIFSLEDLGAPIGFIGYSGNPLARKVMSVYVFDDFAAAVTGAISPITSAIAVILVSFAVAGFLAIKKYVTLKTYATISKGGRWKPRTRKLSFKGLIPVYLFLTLLVLSASMPQIGVIILALTDWAISGLAPKAITFEFVSRLFTDPNVMRAISNSLVYSGVAVLLAVILGSSSTYVIARSKLPGTDVLDSLLTMPIAVPGIVVAVGYFLFFTGFFRGTILDPLVDPALLLIFAYSVRRLPFTARSVFAGLQGVHESLEEVATTLGATRFKSFFDIVVPLIAANVIGGGILTFVYSMSEVSTSVTLGALREDKGPITFYISQVIYGTAAVGTVSVAAALCLLLITVQVIALAVSNYILKQRVAFLGI